ncbi:MAG: hypothetical protein HY597_07300 [Candidatus Omnitrophica bacterium]|nr:hypothetical protein [Candidatus Omnitrophota bacterium]
MKMRTERDAQLKRQLVTMLSDGTFQQILGHRGGATACQFEFHVHRTFHVTVHDHKITVDEFEANHVRRRVRGRWRRLRSPRLHQGRTEVHLPLGTASPLLGRLKKSLGAVLAAALLAIGALAFAGEGERVLLPGPRGGGGGDTTPPARPTVTALVSPTRANPYGLSGAKEANSSLLINGVVRVPLDASTTWSYAQALVEGANALRITSKDAAGNESQALTVSITLDTTAPGFTITSPVDGEVMGIQ